MKKRSSLVIALTLAFYSMTSPVAAFAAGPYQWGDNPGRTHVSNLNDGGGYWNTSALISGISGIGTPEGDSGTGMLFVPDSAPNPSSNGTLYGYDTNSTWVKNANGSMQPPQVWSQAIYGIQNSSPVAWNGNVYVAGSQTLYGFNGANGSKISALKSPTDNIAIPGANNVVLSHPLADPNTNAIWVSSHNSYLFAINPGTLGQMGKVKLAGGTDSSPSIVQDSGGHNRVAVGISNYGGQAGEVEIISDSATNPQVLATYQDPNGASIVGAVVNTGAGNIMWNDINGTVYHANLVYNPATRLPSVTNVTSVAAPSGTFTNEEGAYVHGTYIIPATNSPNIELVNGSTMQMTIVKSASGANNSGTPEISSTTVYVPAADGTITKIPIGVLGGSASYIQGQESSITVGGTAGNLASTNMATLGNPFGSQSTTMTFVTSRGLALFQNLPYPTLGMTVQDNATGQQMSAVSYTSGQIPQFPTLQLPAGTAVNVDVKVLNAPSAQAIHLSSPSVPLIYSGNLQETNGQLPPSSTFVQQDISVNEGSNAVSFTPGQSMKTFDLSAINGGTAPVAMNSVTAQTDVLSAQLSMPGLNTLLAGIKVEWTPVAAATLSLSVTPTTSQTTGKAFALTAGTTNAAGDHVVFTQSGSLTNNGGAGTLSGNFQSNVSSIAYPAQTTATYQYQPTATSSQAGSETVTATLLNSSNQPVLNASGQPLTKSVNAQWTAPAATPSITLAISPTTSQTVNQSFALTATAKNIASNEVVQIAQTTNASPNTLSGSTYVQWVSPGNYASYAFHTTATSSAAQRVTYQASIYTASGQLVPSNTVSAQWGASGVYDGFSSTQNGSLTQAAQTATGSTVTVQVVASPRVVLTLSAQNALFALTGTTSLQVTTDPYGYASFTVNERSGQAGVLKITASSDTAYYVPATDTITWPAASVILTATANGQNYGAGQTASVATGTSVTLTADVTHPPANNYTLQIADIGPGNTFGGQSAAAVQNQATLTAQAVSQTALANEPFVAELFNNATGQMVESGTVNITWNAASSPPPSGGSGGGGNPPPSNTPSITLSAASPFESSISASDSLTAAPAGMPSGDSVQIVQNTLYGDTFVGGLTNSGGGYYVNATTATVNDATGQSGFVATYTAQIITPGGTVVASSGPVNVQWGQLQAPPTISLSISPTTQQENQYVVGTVTVTGIQPGETVWIMNQATYQTANPGAVAYLESGQNGTFQTQFTSSTVGTVNYVAVVESGQVVIGGQTYDVLPAISQPQAVDWTAASSPTITLGVNFLGDMGTYVNGQYVTYPTFGGTTRSTSMPLANTMVGGMISNTVSGVYDPTLAWVSGKQTGSLFVPGGGNGNPTWPMPLPSDYVAPRTYTTASVGEWNGQLFPNYLGWVTVQAAEEGGPGQTSAGYSNLGYIDFLPPTGPPDTSWWNPVHVSLGVNQTQVALNQTVHFSIWPQFNAKPGDAITLSLYNITDPQNATPIATYFATVSGTNTGATVVTWHSGSFSGPVVTLPNTGFDVPYASSVAGTQQFMAYIYEQEQGYNYAANWSQTVSVTWQQPAPTVALTASPTTLYQGQASTLTATANAVPAGDQIVISDVGQYQTLSGANAIASGSSPFQARALSYTPGTASYVATIVNGAGQTVTTSNAVSVTWVALPTLSLTASSSTAPIGTPVTLTAAGSNFPAGYSVRITDMTGDQTFGGRNTATGSTDPFAAQATDNQPQTVTYQAVVMDSTGAAVVTSNRVVVTWQKPLLSGGIISGLYLDPGYPGSSKAPVNMWLSKDMSNPSILYAPSDYYLSYLQQHGWDGSENDQHISLGQAMGGAVNYQPDKNDIPQASQATGTFTVPSGKTYYLYGYGESGLAPWGATPWVWVRPESGFGFKFTWDGTVANPPVGGSVTWTMVNPDGASRTWSTNFQNTATQPAKWVSVDAWMPNPSPIERARTMVAEINASTLKANGSAASETISAYTSIPHYVFVGGGTTSNGNDIQTAVWSLSSSAATVQANSAQINVSIHLVLKDGRAIDFVQPDMATLWNLPVRDIITVGSDTFTAKVKKELANNGGVVGIFPGTMNGVTPPNASGSGTITTSPSGPVMPAGITHFGTSSTISTSPSGSGMTSGSLSNSGILTTSP